MRWKQVIRIIKKDDKYQKANHKSARILRMKEKEIIKIGKIGEIGEIGNY